MLGFVDVTGSRVYIYAVELQIVGVYSKDELYKPFSRMIYIDLYDAWQVFRRGKKPSVAIDAFSYDLEAGLTLLVHEVTTRTYHHGGYQKVSIYEKKRRDLAVAEVRD